MIKGIDVTLYERTQTGVDGFNAPTYDENPVVVHDVLVAPASQQQIIDTLNLTGRRVAYTLAIPKGDAHVWEGNRVWFFGQMFRAFLPEAAGIEENVPLRWNAKISVERYE